LGPGSIDGNLSRVRGPRTVKKKQLAAETFLVAFLIIAASCGNDSDQVSASTHREPAHPALECNGEPSDWFEGDIDLDAPGSESPEAAVDGALDLLGDGYGGEVVEVDPGTIGLSVDGAIVLVVMAEVAPAGGYFWDTFYFCDGFAPSNFGGPAVPLTAPPVTS
jgi:hypothetical protein